MDHRHTDSQDPFEFTGRNTHHLLTQYGGRENSETPRYAVVL